MSSVVIVETPLQMLNAIEASFSLNLGNTILVIITSPPFPEEVFRPLLAFTKWHRIIFFHLIHHAPVFNSSILGKTISERLNEYLKECRQLAKRRKFDNLIKPMANVENLVIGNYLSGYMRHCANRLRPRHLYLIDDGTDTLRVAKLRTEQEVHDDEGQLSCFRKFKNIIRASFVDWDIRQASSLTFFTSYNLGLKPGDRLVRNEYSFFRSMLKQSELRNEVYFLGQPLAEDGYLYKEEYLSYISKIAQYYGGRKLIYVTHKRESSQMIDAIRKMGLPVTSFRLPIEVQLLQDGMPSELASFFCSALDNCRMIFGDKLSIKAFRIEQGKFFAGCEFVQDIYDYISKNVGPNFEIVYL